MVQIGFGRKLHGINQRFLFVNPLQETNKQDDLKINRRVIYEIHTDQGLLNDTITVSQLRTVFVVTFAAYTDTSLTLSCLPFLTST